jgi:hypothetical protein
MPLKTLADLKRTIKPGMRLRCIENTYRPELNGKQRKVVRVFTEQFTRVEDPLPVHALTVAPDGLAVNCVCGWIFKSCTDAPMEDRLEHVKEWADAHEKDGKRESWLRYPKASLFTFDGSMTFAMRLDPDRPDLYVRLEILDAH